MASKSIQGSQELAKKIRSRRNELGFIIEEAAKRAGVGTKTWCRYEAGESIREDKYRGVCKALNWNYMQEESDEEQFSITECRKYEMWSDYIEEIYGEIAAASIAIFSIRLCKTRFGRTFKNAEIFSYRTDRSFIFRMYITTTILCSI